MSVQDFTDDNLIKENNCHLHNSVISYDLTENPQNSYANQL